MNIQIDLGKCIRCGRCAKVCTMGVVTMREGAPSIAQEERCMRCHHCYAACPVGALAMDGLDPAAQKPSGTASPEAVLALLEGRYSCREYRPDQVDMAKIALLRRALNAAPTGCNARATHYVILDDAAKMQAFREMIARKFDEVDPEAAKAEPFLRAVKLMMKRGLDPVLRGAPHLVVAGFDEGAPTGLVDCVIGLSHFEVVAQSLGLGTCWCGFIPLSVSKVWPDMLSYLGLPENCKLGYAMLFGEKVFDYARPVSPNPLK